MEEKRKKINSKLAPFLDRIQKGEVISFEELSEVVSYNAVSKLFDKDDKTWNYPKSINKLLDDLARERGIVIAHKNKQYVLAEQSDITKHQEIEKHTSISIFSPIFAFLVSSLSFFAPQTESERHLIGFVLISIVCILSIIAMRSIFKLAKIGELEILGKTVNS